MKKLILLLTVGALAMNVSAQVQPKSIVSLEARKPIQEQFSYSANFRSALHAGTAKNKSTATMSRWYIPFDMLDNIIYGGNLNGGSNGSVIPIWFDSTVLQRFNTGLGTINFSSVAQVIDPISNNKLFNDPLAYPSEMAITASNAYTVDSVRIAAAYHRVKPGITDTLIISVGVNTGAYFWRKNDPDRDFSWAAPYIPNNDTLWGIAPTSTDSVNRAAFSETATPRAYWKVPMDASMGDPTLTLREFTFAVPGGLNIPAGAGRIFTTFTFKSGDNWVRNVDTFNSMNNFRPFFAEANDGQQMPYHYYGQYRDRNGSSMMFSMDTSWYLPTVVIEAVNSTAFGQEFLYAGIHATCTTCFPTKVGDVNAIIGDVNAYPNPASGDVAIKFTLKEVADVNVTVSNPLGQVLKTKHIEKVSSGKAIFSTADLANGVYFYTIESNGNRVTNRLLVAH